MLSTKKPNRFYSKRQENKVAKITEVDNGKREPNSGATLFRKGDVKTDSLLIECKTLTKPQKSHTIKREWLDKIREEAFSRGKQLSALAFDFGDNGTQFFILQDNDFQNLLSAWLEVNSRSE